MSEQHSDPISAQSEIAAVLAVLTANPLGDQTPLTVNKAAMVLGCSRQTVYRMHWAGKLPFRKNGGATIILLGDIRKAVAAFPQDGPSCNNRQKPAETP